MRILTLPLLCVLILSSVSRADFKADPIWHDGLVEKATYAATRVIYDRPRAYDATFFTNKEQHDLNTLTKSSASTETTEVFKHNQIEVVPTPNYDYKFVTTSHLRVDDWTLTRLDAASQEFCGTSFKQYQSKRGPRGGKSWAYFGFSYMPEAGRIEKRVEQENNKTPVVAFNSLPVFLRGYDLSSRVTLSLALLPDQKSNRDTSPDPVSAEVKYLSDDAQSYTLQLVIEGNLRGTFVFAKDRQNVMLSYEAADGSQTYKLKSVERVDYWTIKGE